MNSFNTFPVMMIVIPLALIAFSSCLVVVAAPPAPPPPQTADPSTRGATGVGAGPEPKDYPYAPANSRVGDLVGFYEKMRENQYDPEVKRKQNLVISLSEAASKFYLLSYGYSLDIKCNKYVELIGRPNIRSFSTIRELMDQPRHFSEVEQKDANLLAHLVGERKFDALSKLQMILQTLESERVGGRSSFEPNVQKDLLHCMNYYIYRHQRATTGLVDYIRTARAKLHLPQVDHMISEVKLKKFSELMENIKRIEQAEREQSRLQTDKWLEEFSNLYELALESHFELPKLVEEFANDPARTERLNLYSQVTTRANELHRELLAADSSPGYNQADLEKNDKYRSSLLELYELHLDIGELLPLGIDEFFRRPDRLQMVEAMLKEKAERSPGDEETKILISGIEDATESNLQGVEPAQLKEGDEHGAELPPVVDQSKPEQFEVVLANEKPEELEVIKAGEPREAETEHGQQQAEPDRIELQIEAPTSVSESNHSGFSDLGSDVEYYSVADEHEVPTIESTEPTEPEEPAAGEPKSPSLTTRLSIVRKVETCSLLANDLRKDMRSFNPTEINVEEARNMAKRVNSFRSNECMRSNAEYCVNSCRSSQWASLSMSKKLLDWTASKMQNERSLPSLEQSALSETLALLQPQQTVSVM